MLEIPQNPEIDDVRIRIHMIRDAPNVNERWNLMKGDVSESLAEILQRCLQHCLSRSNEDSTDAMAELTKVFGFRLGFTDVVGSNLWVEQRGANSRHPFDTMLKIWRLTKFDWYTTITKSGESKFGSDFDQFFGKLRWQSTQIMSSTHWGRFDEKYLGLMLA